MDRPGLIAVLLVIAGACALIFWINHKSDWAMLESGPIANRQKHPIAFWVIQIFWGAGTILFLGGTVIVAFGSG